MMRTTTAPFQLVRNPFGLLVLTTQDGEVQVGITAVRAFPLQTPDEGIALVSKTGKEMAWIARLSDLDGAMRDLVEDELAGSEFMPEISRIYRVSSFATPCTWKVNTDRGATSFILRGEEDIRRLGQNMLLITDIHGIHYLIRDLATMDKSSRHILDRFL